MKELKYLATRAAWQERVESDKEWVKLMLKEKEEAQAKQARGEELSEDEKRRLDYVPQPSMTYEDMLKRYQDSAFYMFGTDEQAYLDYYDTNKDWFYGEGFYNLTVDEDAKAWGIPNNDIRLLDKAISESHLRMGERRRGGTGKARAGTLHAVPVLHSAGMAFLV